MDKLEREEIMSYLPTIQNKSVLELGAGIGRFTSHLAPLASRLTTVDFMQDYVDRNCEVNGHHAHVEFLQADITELELPSRQYDVIFSNWLLMYLTDDEVAALTRKMLCWLKDDGYLFVRESCFHPSGNIKRDTNPTYYRSPTQYFAILNTEIGTPDICEPYQRPSIFELQRAKSVYAYVQAKGNPNQLCFLMRKMPYTAQDYESFQAFLDQNQYSRNGILRYERIFGKTFVSTGGAQTTEEFCQKLDLQPGQKVLDVGCGTGGSAFYMSRKYGVEVRGLDLSTNMVTLALENQAECELEVRNKICFEITDITKCSFEDNSFDVIYSRDTLLHIGDKEVLFSNFRKWLKPGGKLLISDYCRGDQEHSEKFLRYVSQRGYHLLTVKDYGSLLTKVGFQNVDAVDLTQYFIGILEKEMKLFNQDKDSFVEDFSVEDFDAIVGGWAAKKERCTEGDQAWGLFVAEK